ncbi:MAG: amino acid ABC transporter permease [Bifidobacterium sp.]|jgi:polar amino acid transport system permease protein|nr:amino acid ABC transporter permease [Bifidobacterium sp.]MCH4175449.1 amino acid ABC transporter permease [Bifidobacterium sp.]
MSETSWLSVWAGALPEMLDGLKLSLLITVVVILIGMPLGLLLSLGSGSRLKIVRWPCFAIVEIGRGTPALVTLYIIYYGLPDIGLTFNALISSFIGLSITTAAYSCEYIRSGLRSVPRSQIEAGQALDLKWSDIYRKIVIPQGMRIAIPALLGYSIQLFQMTSLTYNITVREITGISYSYGLQTFQYLAVFALAGLLYAAVSTLCTILVAWLERSVALH